jgi:hypothetical protein
MRLALPDKPSIAVLPFENMSGDPEQEYFADVREHKAALSAIERALSFNPSSATALYWGALIHAASGNLAPATAYAHRALRLSPFDPVAFCAHSALGRVEGDQAASSGVQS